jgi:glycolate oxidase iron-sulfur subunit
MTAPAAPEGRGIFTPELLDRCISCGFCLPACPTYVRTGVETSSPRGRIDLMRALESGELPDDDPTVQEEASFCLGCRACEPVCPAGVQYGALLEEWRDHTWNAGRARGSLRRRALLAPLLWAANRPWRLRMMGLIRRHARRRRGGAAAEHAVDAPQLMLGCFERALFPKVSRAAQELIPELQVDPGQGCCGALHAHNGELDRGRELAEELGRRLPGTIVTTSGGCASHLASVLGAERVRELSQYLTGESAPELAAPPAPAARPRIALQDSCHLRNGLGVWREPRELIAAYGDYVELRSASECCGAAGSYSLLRPGDSQRVLDDKLDEIEAAGIDMVVAVNPGCLRQLQTGLKRRGSRVRAVHLAELLVAANDG